MMINFIRYDITIKKLTWYQSHLERSLCIAETVLQLQLLKIRVSCVIPKILKLVVLVDSLYLEIREGSGAEMFTGQIKIPDISCVNVSASYFLYSGRYDSSKLGFQSLPGFIPKQDT